MKSRALPILNAVGCLILSGLIVLQWQRERVISTLLAKLKTELATTQEFSARETKRAADLGRDIGVLKESIEATQKAAETSAQLMEEKATQVTNLETEVAAAREQVKTWQLAITGRDEKLRALNAELIATRRRLDEAIAKLKEAGAR